MIKPTKLTEAFKEKIELFKELEINNFVELLKQIKYSEELTSQNNSSSANNKKITSKNIKELARITSDEYVNKLIEDYKITSENELYEKIDEISIKDIDKRKRDAYEQIRGNVK